MLVDSVQPLCTGDTPGRNPELPGDRGWVFPVWEAPTSAPGRGLLPLHPPRPPPPSTHLELALEWLKDMSLLQEVGGTHTGSCLEMQEGGRPGHFLVAFCPLQVL